MKRVIITIITIISIITLTNIANAHVDSAEYVTWDEWYQYIASASEVLEKYWETVNKRCEKNEMAKKIHDRAIKEQDK